MYEELREKCTKCSNNIFKEGVVARDPAKINALYHSLNFIHQLIFTSEIEDIFAQGLLREGLNNAMRNSVKIL